MTSKKRTRGKRRKRRKQTRKTPQDGPTTDAVSPAIETLGGRILAAGPDYLEDNFIRILQDSVALRQEPEFADLNLEPEQTLETSARHFARFERRFRRAARRGTEEEEEV